MTLFSGAGRRIALALATLWLGTAALPASAAAVDIRAAEEDGYARLVFGAEAPPVRTAEIRGDFLYIRFTESADLTGMAGLGELNAYIEDAGLSDDGTRLTLALAQPLGLRTMQEETASVIELVDPDPTGAPTPVRVRVGEHDTFDRVVFDWRDRVPYTTESNGRTARVTFEAAALPDLAGLYADPPPMIRTAELHPGEDSVTVLFRLSGPGELTHFRDGTKIALDFHPTEEGQVASSGEGERSDGPAPRRVDTPAITKKPLATPEPAEQKTRSSATDGTALQVTSTSSGARLHLPLNQPVPAAVFSRAGYLWIVLSGHHRIDIGALETAGDDLLGQGEVTRREDVTVLRIGLDPAFQVVARRQGAAWEMELSLYPAAPERPLAPERRRDSELGNVIFFETKTAESVVTLEDPEVGDRLAVAPVLATGRGVARERRFAEFVVLKSAQGMAAQLIGDDVSVSKRDDGIAIHGGRALASEAHAEGIPAVPRSESAARALVDFAAWRRGPQSEFRRTKSALMTALANAEESERNRHRRDLAEFFLAHGMAAEALGYLSLMRDDDETLSEDPAFRAMRGIARLQLGRLETAWEDLSHNTLDDRPQIALWRARAAAALEDWEAARKHYEIGLEALPNYKESERARFQLAGLRAALGMGDLDAAEREVRVLDGYDLPKRLSSEVALLRGRLYAERDQSDRALAAYDNVITADYRPTRVRAELARVQTLLDEDAIGRDEAIAELERLRFIWRGDDVELTALRLLGDLYVEDEAYRKALSRMRTAVTQFTDHPDSRTVTRRMGKVFRSLFLGDKAAEMTPLQALALYYDFQELTPVGHEGDEMIRRLADRLVKLDLLDEATELLQHQVEFRLKGTAQAQVAERLAAIYLLNNKPQAALDIILDTRQPQLPENMTRRRRHLEARALIALNRYDEAAELLEDDNTDEAKALRADLHWESENWGEAAKLGRAALGRRWQDADPLSEMEANQVLRLAVAMSLAGDDDGLAQLSRRYGEKMAESPYDRTFRLIAGQDDAGGEDLRKIVESVADVSAYEAYLQDYKDELAAPPKAL